MHIRLRRQSSAIDQFLTILFVLLIVQGLTGTSPSANVLILSKTTFRQCRVRFFASFGQRKANISIGKVSIYMYDRKHLPVSYCNLRDREPFNFSHNGLVSYVTARQKTLTKTPLGKLLTVQYQSHQIKHTQYDMHGLSAKTDIHEKL